MMSKRVVQNSDKNFELKLANGKSGSFKSGYDMWKFATQHNPKLEQKFSQKSGPFLCDFFERLRKK